MRTAEYDLLPIVANELYPHYARFAERQEARPAHLADFETQTFQWTHAEAGAHVMLAWGFPDDLICCTALHQSGLQLLADPTHGRGRGRGRGVRDDSLWVASGSGRDRAAHPPRTVLARLPP